MEIPAENIRVNLSRRPIAENAIILSLNFYKFPLNAVYNLIKKTRLIIRRDLVHRIILFRIIH
jgi:hypothetical protein